MDKIELELLLKEYEQCTENIRHNDIRLWTSTAIFSGSIGALVWLATRLESINFLNITIIAVGSILLGLILFYYLRFFISLEYFDRVEHHRAEEIERALGYWRLRYILHTKETDADLARRLHGDEIGRIKRVRKRIESNLSWPNFSTTPFSRIGNNEILKRIIIVLIFLCLALFFIALIELLSLCNWMDLYKIFLDIKWLV